MNKWCLYFAFGSNLNTARMRGRCPSMRVIGKATLSGWRLVERLYADIEPGNGRVNGILYAVSHFDLRALDYYEGAPRVYARRLMTIEYNNARYLAYTYIMTPATARRRQGIPFPEKYRMICAAGAAEHHLHIPEFNRREVFA